MYEKCEEAPSLICWRRMTAIGTSSSFATIPASRILVNERLSATLLDYLNIATPRPP